MYCVCERLSAFVPFHRAFCVSPSFLPTFRVVSSAVAQREESCYMSRITCIMLVIFEVKTMIIMSLCMLLA